MIDENELEKLIESYDSLKTKQGYLLSKISKIEDELAIKLENSELGEMITWIDNYVVHRGIVVNIHSENAYRLIFWFHTQKFSWDLCDF
jgi:hypothetical protein